MSAKAIYETDGKSLLANYLKYPHYVKNKFAVVAQDTNLNEIGKEHPWLNTEVRYTGYGSLMHC